MDKEENVLRHRFALLVETRTKQQAFVETTRVGLFDGCSMTALSPISLCFTIELIFTPLANKMQISISNKKPAGAGLYIFE